MANKYGLKKGVWYKDSDSLKIFRYMSDARDGDLAGYGFLFGEWFGEQETSGRGVVIRYPEEATKEEVFEAFKREAKKRGIVKGAVCNNHHGTWTYNGSKIINEVESRLGGCDGIYSNQDGWGRWICLNGVWAEIIAQEKSTPVTETGHALEVPTYLKMEIHKWYKMYIDNERFTLFQFNGDTGQVSNQHGFNANGDWSETLGLAFPQRIEVAHTKLVKIMLTVEAKKRGLVDGATIQLLKQGFYKNPKAYSKYKLTSFGDFLIEGQYSWISIFSEGKWATPEETQKMPEPIEVPTKEEILKVLTYLKTINK